MLQGAVLLAMLFGDALPAFLLVSALGHVTFLAAGAEYAPLAQQAHSVGIFRFWRDSGYAVGALLTGVLADAFGLEAALAAIGSLTVLSALVVQGRMFCLPLAEASGSPCERPTLTEPRPGWKLTTALPAVARG